MTDKYIYTDDMDELSGFGGGYEAACRRMAVAGMRWLEAHPDANPQYSAFGIEENEDAKKLTEVILAEVPDCTGAMFGAAISHARFVHKNGWDKYAEEMRARKRTAQEAR